MKNAFHEIKINCDQKFIGDQKKRHRPGVMQKFSPVEKSNRRNFFEFIEKIGLKENGKGSENIADDGPFERVTSRSKKQSQTENKKHPKKRPRSFENGLLVELVETGVVIEIKRSQCESGNDERRQSEQIREARIAKNPGDDRREKKKYYCCPSNQEELDLGGLPFVNRNTTKFGVVYFAEIFRHRGRHALSDENHDCRRGG